MMEFKVNVNMNVKVKLTDFGVSILKTQHDELNELIKDRGGQGIGDFYTNVDDDGYYEMQLWSLMNRFGPYMSPTQQSPFDLDIIVSNGTPTENFLIDLKKLMGVRED